MSNINTILIKRRLNDSQLGTELPVLSGGELAFNEVNNTLYFGRSTGTIAIGGDGTFATNTLVSSISSDLQYQIGTLDIKVDNEVTTLNTTIQSVSSTLDQRISDEIGTLDIKVDNEVTTLNTTIQSVSSTLDRRISDEIAAVIDMAPEALNTLNELASALGDDENFAANLTNSLAQINSNIVSLSSASDELESSLTSTITSVSSTLDSKIDSEVTTLEGSIENLTTYVDTNFLNLTGGDLSGGLTVTGDISASGTIAAAGGLEIAGGSGGDTTLFVGSGMVGIGTETPNEELTVVGDISATGQVFVAEPVDANAATTKGYVDGRVSSLSASVDEEVSTLNTTVQSVSSTLDSRITSEVSTLNTTVQSVSSTLDSRITSEVSTLNTTVQTVSGDLQGQINSILSNVDPSALDSLTEIVSAFQAADGELNNAITILSNAATTELTSVSAFLDAKIDNEVLALETTVASVSGSLDSKIDTQISSLSSTVDANFVEKTESDAVTLNGGLTVTNGFTVDTITVSGGVTFSADLSGNGSTSTIYGFVIDGGSF